MIRHRYTLKGCSWFFIWLMMLTIMPTNLMALTGGPSQPEVQAFQPIGVTNMVDPSTGDFSYNIPLLEVGGYPINLVYNAGVTMDQEASNVGLGWTLNPGAINRTVRGIPDDFKDESIETETNLRRNWTVGVNAGLGTELFGKKLKKVQKGKIKESKGLKKIKPSLGISYNSYKGLQAEFGISPAIAAAQLNKSGLTANLGFDLSFNSASGNSLKPKLSLITDHTKLIKKKNKTGGEQKDIYFKKIKSSFAPNLSFADPSYTPTIRNDMKNLSVTGNFMVNVELFGAAAGLRLTGYYSEQKLANKSIQKPSFGVMYSEYANGRDDALLDFNREKDIGFSKDVPNLPLTQFTNDTYSLSGQGIGGAYQLKRGDIGFIYDGIHKNVSNGGSVGFEAGGGNLLRLGSNFHANHGNSKTGPWNHDKRSEFDFKPIDIGNDHYEPAYFKAANEPAIMDVNDPLYDIIGKDRSIRVDLNNKTNTKLEGDFSNGKGIANLKRDRREKRSQSISYLTAEQADVAGLSKKIENYPLNSGLSTQVQPTPIDRVGQGRAAHHLSEITAVKEDGSRYVFGIPAYNFSKTEVSFNTDGNVDCNSGTVQYSIDADNSLNNKKGTNYYYNKVRTPAYAHALLLTSILSDDYSDLTDNGPSPDDLGAYTKINYSRIHNNYRWRMPYSDAIYNEGHLSDETDDQGSYTYGEKEQWIVHSIESKTQLAEFYYSDRKDGHGVVDENGGIDTSLVLKKLDKIVLYSRPDRKKAGVNSYEPIKTVFFKYDYSLCKQVETNDGTPVVIDKTTYTNDKGKLTLKEVYFRYGTSHKGKFSPYKFDYSNFNPDYNPKAYNRWGTYQPVDVKNQNPNLNNCDVRNSLSSTEFPYINQYDGGNNYAKGLADEYASAWNLNNIKLPSGAEIDVTYEADDYAYVQNSSAMQMMEIVETASVPGLLPSFVPGDKLPLFNGTTNNNYIYLRLSHPINGSLSANQARLLFKKRYLKELTMAGDVYFKVLGKITDDEEYEYVSGYYDIDGTDYGVAPKASASSEWEYAYIKFDETCTGDRDQNSNGNCPGLSKPANPISKAIWQYARLNLPKKINGDLDVGEGSDETVMHNALKHLSNSFSGFATFFRGGFNNKLKAKGFGQSIISGKSWIRLYNPSGIKLAGTHRVAKIEINDNWSNMAGGSNQSSTYGQEYIYNTIEKENKASLNGTVFYDQIDSISSGVAAYEPLLGGDENPFRQPDGYTKENKLAPNDEHYLEQPYGESFFPSPTIIYSKVVVRNLQHASVNLNATGHTVHEFYTAKDFPTKTKRTGTQQRRKRSNPILKILKIQNKDNLTASQGYVIELNDMHGKPKAQSVYNQWGVKISGMSYHYQQDAQGLVNEVKTYDGTRVEKDALLGVEYQMVSDSRESKTENYGGGVDLNNDNFLVGFFPIVAVIPWMSVSKEKTQFRSVVLTKIIRKMGVLEKTVGFDLGSSVSTRNLIYDHMTGQPLVTKTFNEFEDAIVNINTPAHWAYKGMEPAFINIGAEFEMIRQTTMGPGKFELDGYTNTRVGDEILITKSNNQLVKGWILSKSSSYVTIIDINGNPINESASSGKIIRSGRRNLANVPIGTTTMLNENSNEIINASATEYFEDRFMDCCQVPYKNSVSIVNPFVQNLLGTYRPLKSYTFLSDRKKTNNPNADIVNLSEDGTYENFSPFWRPTSPGSTQWTDHKQDWTWTSELTKINQNGKALESKDPLMRHSAEILGYFDQLVVGVAGNAKHNQIAYDGFEDYNYNETLQRSLKTCPKPRHFGFTNIKPKLNQAIAHSGDYYLEIPPDRKAIALNGIFDSNDCKGSNLNQSTIHGSNQLLDNFKIDECNCLGTFKPDPGKYIFSAWVYQGQNPLNSKVVDAQVTIDIDGIPISLNPEGELIEHWQRIFSEFEIPVGSQSIKISVTNLSNSNPIGIDDIRIHPYDASFKSYIYDEHTLKYTYGHDENNYFTEYHYNAAGDLERVMKETERGVMMIQESRFGQQKKLQ